MTDNPCKLRGWTVPDPVHGNHGVRISMCVCDAHGYSFPPGATVGSGMCPVGVIAHAIEDGINRINEAFREATRTKAG